MKICAIIPTYNHYKDLGEITTHLANADLPIFIIDDGSNTTASGAIAQLQSEAKHIIVKRLSANRGKGGAVIEGFHLANAGGYTHALQIDADGQHDLAALPRFLEKAALHPDALIAGRPFYDSSIPRGREIGRWVTHIWVWIETLSFRIKDSMCGFRIYPLAAVNKLLSEEKLGTHMDFDTDIMVRLFWRGITPIAVPVGVIYPPGNSSNFRLWQDNWRITKMHTRLCLTMLLRLPFILMHRPPYDEADHWAQLRERGALWGLRFCAFAYRMLGRGGCRIVMAPIVLYFYVSGTKQRRGVNDFLTRVLKHPPAFTEAFSLYMNFAMRAVDVFAAWTGRLKKDAIKAADPLSLATITNDPRGGLFITSHIGNAEIARAMLEKKTRDRLTILVHTRHAENYNNLLQNFSPDAAVNVRQVTEMGPETIIDLKQRIEKGEWIVIAGDRVSVKSRERSVLVPFFDKEAAFPEGPWILGSLLECPVYLLFCLQKGGHYRFTLEPFADIVSLPRAERQIAIQSYAACYAARLQQFAQEEPLQWYNFYNFWAP